MQGIARERQMTMVEAVLERRQLEQRFLAERCEHQWLTAEQRATIRRRIDDLERQSLVLRWFLGALQPDRRSATHQ
jgi:DeoR/GlpR family transcriptional regulator of sugar metabolism